MIRSDLDIRNDIEAQLGIDDSIDPESIQVRVRDGKVDLTGTVTDYEAYDAALKDARMIRGVVAIIDQLRIEYPVDMKIPNDTEIRNRILNVFEWSPAIDVARVDAEVVDGMATLIGSVDTYWQKQRAENLAYLIAGVLKVANELNVSLTEDVADDMVRQNLLSAFKRNLYLETGRIDVMVRNGFVTLSGTVPDWFGYRIVSDIACHAAGIRGIVNNIAMSSEVIPIGK